MKTKFLYVALFTAAFAVAFQSCKQGQPKEKEEAEEQELNVPEVVTTAFQAKFAGAAEVEWGMEEDSVYEAEFELNDREMTANFDATGTWLETEYSISESALPPIVMDSVKSLFENPVVEKAEVSETPQGKVFELQLKTDDNVTEAVFDQNGTLVKKEQMKEENEENEEHAAKEEQEENEEHEEGGEGH